MKKILFLVITLLVLAGCDKADEGVLKVGMDLRYPPFEMVDSSGNPVGISVAMANELGEYLGKEVEIVNTEFGALIPSLETGKIDVILASMSITEDRAKKIDFSDPYFYFPIITLVNNEAGISSVDDLWSKEGLRFVAPEGFFTIDLINDNANQPMIYTADVDAAILQVKDGKADAFLISPATVVDANQKYPLETSILWEAVDRSPIGIGVEKGNDELLGRVNDWIDGLEENGVYDRVGELYQAEIEETLPGQTLRFYIDE